MADTLEQLKGHLGGAVLGTHSWRGDDTAIVKKESLVDAAAFLRDELHFEMLMDETCVDLSTLAPEEPFWPALGGRFELVAHFYSVSRNLRVRIKARSDEADAKFPSLYPIYKSANFMEREIFDMFGVAFEGHPDMRRILMYDEFVGHPLRKDYPVGRQQPLIPMDLEAVNSSAVLYTERTEPVYGGMKKGG